MSTRAPAAKRRTTEPGEPLAVTELAPAGVSSDGAAVPTASVAEATTKKRAKKEIPGREPDPFPADLDPHNWSHFDHFLFQLLAFRVKHSNFSVHRDKHMALHAWLQVLKKEYKTYTACTIGSHSDPQQQQQRSNKSRLTQQQVEVLEFYHIPLTSRGDDHWMRFYTLLCQYRERHGHCLVPRLSEVPGLGDWVTDQRRQAKQRSQGQQTSLTEERQQMLDSLGFVWQVRQRPEWERRYEELLQYKAKHGDCKVPQHYKGDRALGKWVAKQREQYRLKQKGEHSFLTDDRIEKLENCGFAWQVRSSAGYDPHNPHVSTDVVPRSSRIIYEAHDPQDNAHVGDDNVLGPPLQLPIRHHQAINIQAQNDNDDDDDIAAVEAALRHAVQHEHMGRDASDHAPTEAYSV